MSRGRHGVFNGYYAVKFYFPKYDFIHIIAELEKREQELDRHNGWGHFRDSG